MDICFWKEMSLQIRSKQIRCSISHLWPVAYFGIQLRIDIKVSVHWVLAIITNLKQSTEHLFTSDSRSPLPPILPHHPEPLTTSSDILFLASIVHRLVSSFLGHHINGITQYVFSCVSGHPSAPTQGFWDRSMLLSIAVIISFNCWAVFHGIKIYGCIMYSFADGYLGCYQFNWWFFSYQTP